MTALRPRKEGDGAEMIDEGRKSEPIDIYTITKGVMENIRRRSNEKEFEAMEREKAIFTPDTAENRRRFINEYDFQVGNIVQIKTNCSRGSGRLGRIIGIRYFQFDDGREDLSYTVQFSDKEAEDYFAKDISFVRGAM